MVSLGWCRNVVNQRCRRIVRAFKWAVSEELIPESTWRALTTVRGLERGRTEAKETEPVGPVADSVVEATLPFVLPAVAAMVRLQRLTGMRPGEACGMRSCDLDTAGPVWLYRPAVHKTAHRGKARVIALGPKAQDIVRGFLTLDTQAFLFSPRRAMEARRVARRAARKSKVQPSQQDRRKRKTKRRPGERYSSESYARCVARACQRAEVPAWHPNQLRHTHATEVRRRFGLEAAQVALGHSQADVTQVYAERDQALAVRVASEIE
jgi:integrase